MGWNNREKKVKVEKIAIQKRKRREKIYWKN